MRIAYLTTYDSSDRRNWSGSGFSIRECLRNSGAEIFPIGPLTARYSVKDRIKRKLYKKILGKEHEIDRLETVCSEYARQVNAKTKEICPDFIFSPGSIPASRLDGTYPSVIFMDATYASYIEHYGIRDLLTPESIEAGNRTEKLAYEKARILFFASDWAASSAIRDYGVEESKIRVVPFGANFKIIPEKQSVLSQIEIKDTAQCKLVSIGVDWERKGMNRSVELASALNLKGLPTKLTIIGCRPPRGTDLPPFVTVVDFIDKGTRYGEEQLSKHLLSSHFHVLFPSAEAFGIVFAEANAHGVPNLTYNTGGISSAVRSGYGGRCFSAKENDVSYIADFICSIMREPNAYRNWAKCALREYEERLNWPSIGQQLLKDVRSLLL